jgi:hypothetical protein
MKTTLRLCLMAWLFVCVGCGKSGPETVRVEGSITFDGKPLAEGKITLTPMDNTQGGSFAGEIKQGKYEIPKENGPLVDGTYKVEISALAKQGKSLPNVVDPGGAPLAVFEELIPPTYNRDSTLSLKASAEAKGFDFNLTKSGK